MTVLISYDVKKNKNGLNGPRSNISRRVEITQNTFILLRMANTERKMIFKLEQEEGTIVGNNNLKVILLNITKICSGNLKITLFL